MEEYKRKRTISAERISKFWPSSAVKMQSTDLTRGSRLLSRIRSTERVMTWNSRLKTDLYSNPLIIFF